MRKRFLSILLALALCLSMLPAIALADEHTEHADENHDHLCDTCGMPHYTVVPLDDKWVCSIDGCDALETNVNAEYTNLYYYENYEKAGEVVAGGTVDITVTVPTNDSSAAPETVDNGKVVVYWTDKDGELIPFSEAEMPITGGTTTVFFGGVPVESLNYGHLIYYPDADSAKYLPSANGLVLDSQENAHKLYVESNLEFSINYTPAEQLPVLSGTYMTIELLTAAEGNYAVAFNEDNADLEYTKEGNTITFTMPDKDVEATITWISCTRHADSDNDHKCDVCEEVYSTCEDKNNDHKCDVCKSVLSTCDDGTVIDHKCDICKKAMPSLCEDNNGDHRCDIAACGALIANACKDDNGDHYCDNSACNRQMSTCESSDANGDDICDVCGEAIYWLEVNGIKVNSQNKDNILEDETASAVYDPETKTLTLHDADIQTSGNYGIRSKLPQSAVLNIELVGDNRIAVKGVYGLRSTADVVISGSGSLDISAGDIAIYLDGAGSEYGSLTLCEDVEVTAAGGTVTYGSGFGVKLDDCLTVRDNAKLTASSYSAPDRSSGIYAIDVITVQDNAQIIATGGDLSGRPGTDSYGIRTTHVCVHGGSLTSVGGDAADSIGIYTQTFDMTGGSVYASGSDSTLGPSYGLRSNKYLNLSGGSIVAIGGQTQNDQSCGLMVNNTSSSYPGDGGTLTVTGGQILAVGKSGAFSYGVKANNISVSDGCINANADDAVGSEGSMTISSGITADSTFTVTGGRILAQGASAGTFSYGIQAFDMTVNGGFVSADSGSAAASYGLWSFDEMSISEISTVIRASSESGYAVYSVMGIDIQRPLGISCPENGVVANVADGPETYYVISSNDGTAAKTVQISVPPSSIPEPDYDSGIYPVVEKESDEPHGTVSLSKTYASSGETVTVTVTPDKYYRVDKIIVRSESGEEIETTLNADGSYSFTMPAGKVSVEAVYVWENPFVDVAEDSFYTDAVEWALRNGITEGTGTNTFSPNASCTRAQMVTFLWRAFGSPAPESSDCPFTDVDLDSYYGKAVLWAIENGITNGTSNTSFSPDADCTRAQLVTFLWRAHKSPAADAVNPFTDVAADAYYADAVLWAVKEEVTNGTSDTSFSPDADCTRAQLVTFLYRALADK